MVKIIYFKDPTWFKNTLPKQYLILFKIVMSLLIFNYWTTLGQPLKVQLLVYFLYQVKAVFVEFKS